MKKKTRRGLLFCLKEENDVFEVKNGKRSYNLDKWRLNNYQSIRKEIPLKEIARTIARKLIKKLIQCELCNKTEGKLVRHHSNYYKYSEVIILCAGCHAKLHSFDPIGWKKKNK
mgnify:CR=1 FL=1